MLAYAICAPGNFDGGESGNKVALQCQLVWQPVSLVLISADTALDLGALSVEDVCVSNGTMCKVS